MTKVKSLEKVKDQGSNEREQGVRDEKSRKGGDHETDKEGRKFEL